MRIFSLVLLYMYSFNFVLRLQYKNIIHDFRFNNVCYVFIFMYVWLYVYCTNMGATLASPTDNLSSGAQYLYKTTFPLTHSHLLTD